MSVSRASTAAPMIASPLSRKIAGKLRSLKQNLPLLLASSWISFILLVFAYEIFETIRYRSWHARYDNSGWFGTLTVRSANPTLMWEYKANAEHKYIKTNRYGFRDRDSAGPKKPEGTFRVGFLGDSVVQGFGVEKPEEVLVRRLEAALSERLAEPVVETLNFGVDGYNTVQVAELLRAKVIRFSLDEVVYLMCLNDFDFEDASDEKIRFFKRPKSFFLWRLGKLYKRWRLIWEDYHDYHFHKTRGVVFGEISKMNELATRKGSGFLVVIVPAFHADSPSFEQYSLVGLHAEIRRTLATNGVEVVDLLDDFIVEGEPPAFYAKDIWHPTAEGHRVIAAALVEPLQARIEDAWRKPRG